MVRRVLAKDARSQMANDLALAVFDGDSDIADLIEREFDRHLVAEGDLDAHRLARCDGMHLIHRKLSLVEDRQHFAAHIARGHGQIGNAHDHGRALRVFRDAQPIVDRRVATGGVQPGGAADLPLMGVHFAAVSLPFGVLLWQDWASKPAPSSTRALKCEATNSPSKPE